MFRTTAITIGSAMLLATAAHAELVTTGDLSIVCQDHFAVQEALNAIVNKPASMKVDDVVAPLGCVEAGSGFTFIPTGSSFEAVLPGLIVGPDGKSTPVYVNEGGVKER